MNLSLISASGQGHSLDNIYHAAKIFFSAMNTLNTRSGASLNPYMSKIDICESEPADFLSFGSSNFILRRRAFRLKDYDPTDSLQLRFEFDHDDLESFLNIGIIKVGFQIDALFLANDWPRVLVSDWPRVN